MAYRLLSHHRAFFSPKYLAGSTSYITTTATRRLTFDVKTQEEFEEKVLKADKPVIVDFHATWCGPCKILTPKLMELVGQHEGSINLAKVDIDELTDLAMEYGVHSVPTVLGVKDGDIVDKFIGVVENDKLKEFAGKLTAK